MYDLHCHFLPGVDDGARSAAETDAMLRDAAEDGTVAVLATPHRKDVTEDWSVDHLKRLMEEAEARLADGGLELEIFLGMENHLDPELAGEIEAGRALPINGTQYILVEMPFFGRPDWIEPSLEAVMSLGYVPVLAHPERIEAFQEDPAMLREFNERGMLSQITVGSLVGLYGSSVREFTEGLLGDGIAHMLASDGHSASAGGRRAVLTPGVEAAARIVGAAAARRLVVDAPRAVLRGEDVDVPAVGSGGAGDV